MAVIINSKIFYAAFTTHAIQLLFLTNFNKYILVFEGAKTKLQVIKKKPNKMNNKTKITSALRALLVCGFLLSTSFLRAQSCNVTINNNLTCDLQMDISFFELTPTCGNCGGNPINVTVTNSGSTALNCLDVALWACTAAICDISVTFTSPITAGPIFYSGGTQSLSGLPAGCGATVNANITFTANTIVINP